MPKKVNDHVRIWIDVEDFFVYFASARRPSGIQRLTFELHKSLRMLAGPDRVRFVRHNLPGITFGEVAWEEVEALFSGRVIHDAHPAARPKAASPRPFTPPLIRNILYRLPLPVRDGLIRAGKAQLAAFRAQLDAFRSLPGIIRGAVQAVGPSRKSVVIPLSARVAPGDVLAILGAPWTSTQYAEMLALAREQHGMKTLVLIYDLIPLRRPEWVEASTLNAFSHWFDSCLPHIDLVAAISRATAHEFERCAAGRGVTLRSPVTVIPVGTGFAGPPAPDTVVEIEGLPPAGTYVMFVSTIEARKNHQVLFRAWRRLLDEMPAEQVPTLVFAGRVGWLVEDFMQQLRNAEWLGGKIVLVESPSDAELVQLYLGCRFTLFPSLYEGWGLPVTESLMFGKPCLVSNVTSLPEAGGALARYFDPDDLNDVVRVIRETISDPAGLAEWEARVKREFRPVSWDESARAILEAIE